jgi:hypothetical protein
MEYEEQLRFERPVNLSRTSARVIADFISQHPIRQSPSAEGSDL